MAETTPTQQLPLQLPASETRLSFASPRVVIRFCTQCKWMLRAAYFAQELLSTFSTSLGEVALQPATGGVFVVEIYHRPNTEKTTTTTISSTASNSDEAAEIQKRVLWDRKVDGGFPETKELKRRVRDVIEPDRNLGHVDRDYPTRKPQQAQSDIHTAAGTTSEAFSSTSQENNAMSEPKSEPKQPPGPRWSQANKSEPLAQEEQSSSTTATATTSGSRDQQQQQSTGEKGQGETRSVNVSVSSLRPRNQQKNTDSNDGPVYDPRMAAGGIKPVIPPVALRGGVQIQESQLHPQHQPQSQSQSQGQRQTDSSSSEVCGDCQ